MSQAGRKGGGKGPPKDNKNSDDSKDKDNGKSGSKDKDKDKEKEETGSNPEDEPVASKPQSAGATSRDAATKVLNLCMKGEWAPVEQVLKSIEKSIANAGDDANTIPLLGVADVVSIMCF